MAEKGPRIWQVPEGDNRQRLVCPDCEFVHYDNPKVVVGSVTTQGEKILLCRRAIEPRKGFWTLPAGFLELNESPIEGAKREAREEANAEIEIETLLGVYHVERISQVQLFYRASLRSPEISAGEESEEVGLFLWDEIPWDDLAFPTVKWVLAHYQKTLGQEVFAVDSNPEN